MTEHKGKIILGIDPGTNITGFGVLSCELSQVKLVAAGVIDLSTLDDHHLKLKRIFERTLSLIETYLPDEMAIEAPFFGKNVQSMLKLGRAQGVAIAAGLSRSLPVTEYSPKKIKQSITGNGNASKEQVASMLQQLLHFDEMPRYLDATDGLAAAMCHFYQGNTIHSQNKSGYKSWSSFLTENPERKI